MDEDEDVQNELYDKEAEIIEMDANESTNGFAQSRMWVLADELQSFD